MVKWVTLWEAVTTNTFESCRTTSFGTRKEDTKISDTGVPRRTTTSAVSTTRRRIRDLATRRPRTKDTDKGARERFDTGEPRRTTLRVGWVTWLVTMSEDTGHVVRTCSVTRTRELDTEATNTLITRRTVVIFSTLWELTTTRETTVRGTNEGARDEWVLYTLESFWTSFRRTGFVTITKDTLTITLEAVSTRFQDTCTINTEHPVRTISC